jgi:hypothetical protein
MMARAQGAVGIGPVRELSQLPSAVEEGIAKVKAGDVCVVDVRVMPGYDSAAHPTLAAASRR